uniref:Uncharacterized protein n=1 Tax=Ananas comosus var. bracteatus TaxID=296719 RepID=A0A6V7PUX4_ANACO|nr:unnamed protein product [Ananas comosus var. bracteatus]
MGAELGGAKEAPRARGGPARLEEGRRRGRRQKEKQQRKKKQQRKSNSRPPATPTPRIPPPLLTSPHQNPNPNPNPNPRLRPSKSTAFKREERRRRKERKRQQRLQTLLDHPPPSLPPDPTVSDLPWPCDPTPSSPPTPTTAWPAAAAASAAAVAVPAPSAAAHAGALRASRAFFAEWNGEDDDSEEEEGEGDAIGGGAARGFFKGLFARDGELREYYEREWARGEFRCLVCEGVGARAGSDSGAAPRWCSTPPRSRRRGRGARTAPSGASCAASSAGTTSRSILARTLPQKKMSLLQLLWRLKIEDGTSSVFYWFACSSYV